MVCVISQDLGKGAQSEACYWRRSDRLTRTIILLPRAQLIVPASCSMDAFPVQDKQNSLRFALHDAVNMQRQENHFDPDGLTSIILLLLWQTASNLQGSPYRVESLRLLLLCTLRS